MKWDIPEVPAAAMIGSDRNSQRIGRLLAHLQDRKRRGFPKKAVQSYLDELDRRLSKSRPARQAGVTVKPPRI